MELLCDQSGGTGTVKFANLDGTATLNASTFTDGTISFGEGTITAAQSTAVFHLGQQRDLTVDLKANGDASTAGLNIAGSGSSPHITLTDDNNVTIADVQVTNGKVTNAEVNVVAPQIGSVSISKGLPQKTDIGIIAGKGSVTFHIEKGKNSAGVSIGGFDKGGSLLDARIAKGGVLTGTAGVHFGQDGIADVVFGDAATRASHFTITPSASTQFSITQNSQEKSASLTFGSDANDQIVATITNGKPAITATLLDAAGSAYSLVRSVDGSLSGTVRAFVKNDTTLRTLTVTGSIITAVTPDLLPDQSVVIPGMGDAITLTKTVAQNVASYAVTSANKKLYMHLVGTAAANVSGDLVWVIQAGGSFTIDQKYGGDQAATVHVVLGSDGTMAGVSTASGTLNGFAYAGSINCSGSALTVTASLKQGATTISSTGGTSAPWSSSVHIDSDQAKGTLTLASDTGVTGSVNLVANAPGNAGTAVFTLAQAGQQGGLSVKRQLINNVTAECAITTGGAFSAKVTLDGIPGPLNKTFALAVDDAGIVTGQIQFAIGPVLLTINLETGGLTASTHVDFLNADAKLSVTLKSDGTTTGTLSMASGTDTVDLRLGNVPGDGLTIAGQGKFKNFLADGTTSIFSIDKEGSIGTFNARMHSDTDPANKFFNLQVLDGGDFQLDSRYGTDSTYLEAKSPGQGVFELRGHLDLGEIPNFGTGALSVNLTNNGQRQITASTTDNSGTTPLKMSLSWNMPQELQASLTYGLATASIGIQGARVDEASIGIKTTPLNGDDGLFLSALVNYHNQSSQPTFDIISHIIAKSGENKLDVLIEEHRQGSKVTSAPVTSSYEGLGGDSLFHLQLPIDYNSPDQTRANATPNSLPLVTVTGTAQLTDSTTATLSYRNAMSPTNTSEKSLKATLSQKGVDCTYGLFFSYAHASDPASILRNESRIGISVTIP